MKAEQPKLQDLVDIRDPDAVFEEARKTLRAVAPDVDDKLMSLMICDAVSVFEGRYPGYRASNTEYHDLQHTSLVFLAAARLLDGLCLEGQSFSAKEIHRCMTAALFHDIGLIQGASDPGGSGAKYTTVHEQRSIDFIENYLSEKGFSNREIQDCTHMIMGTKLSLSPGDIPFRTESERRLGGVVGTADLLAQMADREYLEKLFLLFREFQEGQIPGFHSDLDLLFKTQDFYDSIVKKRLDEDFQGVRHAAAAHFRKRWGLKRDLYDEAISRNLVYLRRIVDICGTDYECYAMYLKRGGILRKVLDVQDP